MVEATKCQEEARLVGISTNDASLMAVSSCWIYAIFHNDLSNRADIQNLLFTRGINGGLLLDYDQVTCYNPQS